jgi:hypothetical protein
VARKALALAIGASALAVPGVASAYCRTTTVLPPIGYDPAVSGCWSQGIPLRWSSDRAPYGVSASASTQVPLAEVTRIADAAFHTWNTALCGGQPPALQAYDDGPILSVPDASYLVPAGGDASALAIWASCGESSSCDASAHDVIVFDDDAWPHDDPVNTLALTTVTYGVDDGKIFEAYTEVNSFQNQLTTTEPPAPDSAGYDLQAILTHEAGHFLGLAHSTDTTAIMYAFYKPGAIALTADDVDAICAAQPAAPASSGCSCTAGRGPDTAALALLPCAVLIVLGRRTRRA